MSSEQNRIEQAVARHTREIAELQEQLQALKDGHAKQELQAELDQRVADMEAEIRLQELQETMSKEQQAEPRKKRWFFGRR